MVDFLDHCLELCHDALHLMLLVDALLLEHTCKLCRDLSLVELELVCKSCVAVLAFEDQCDQHLHAQTHDRFFCIAVYLNCHRKLNYSLNELRPD